MGGFAKFERGGITKMSYTVLNENFLNNNLIKNVNFIKDFVGGPCSSESNFC